MARDPRQYPYGYFSGADYSGDSTARAFVWFSTVDELATFLLDVEPQIWNLEAGDGLEAFQEEIKSLIQRIRSEGLTADVLDSINAASKGWFQIDWWGTFTDLCAGNGEVPATLVEDFLTSDEDRARTELTNEDIEEFVEYCRNCGG
jgi:hypothetical protein